MRCIWLPVMRHSACTIHPPCKWPILVWLIRWIFIVMCILHILFKSLANWIDRLEAKPHIWIWHRRLCLFKLIAAAAAPLWLCTRSQVLLPAQWLGHRCSCSRTQRIYSWWLRVCDCRGKMRAPACHGWPPTTIRICADCPFGGAAGVE